MLVDSHCHLDFPELEQDRAGVVARAKAAGVTSMVTISTRVAKFATYAAIAESDPDIWCTVGTHPLGVVEEPDVPLERLLELSAHPKCVGIGEAGLDYHYDTAARDVAERVFRTHIEAARMTKLPLVIHARDCDDDMIRILADEMGKGTFPAVLHCFSSGPRLAEIGVELGLSVSLSGILTFKKSDEIRAIAKRVPLDRLLVETDAPFLAPQKHRGKRNEPSFVVETAKMLADVHGVSDEQMAKITTDNFFSLFSKAVRPQ
ncbi:MAG: TatD family hydrolase [Hyphomicrobiales bacterium]|nr:TatD family hydrolase [Hyphomicrobiales bacterium]